MLERPKGLRGKERGSTRSRKQPLCAENNSDLCWVAAWKKVAN